MTKKMICSLHDSIIELCSRQEKLLVANKTHTKNFKMNFEKNKQYCKGG